MPFWSCLRVVIREVNLGRATLSPSRATWGELESDTALLGIGYSTDDGIYPNPGYCYWFRGSLQCRIPQLSVL
jgi:hypothetical protein